MTTIDMTESYEVARAMVAMGEAIAARMRASDASVIDALCTGHTVSDSRRESLIIALGLGADDSTLVRLRDAGRLDRSGRRTVDLPPGRYEHCSRGRGWARRGRGDSAVWGERVDAGYRVGVGRWTVGSTDGFSRKSSEDWTVEHIRVGTETWTVAS
jgi:hypothetical protein